MTTDIISYDKYILPLAKRMELVHFSFFKI